MIKQWKKEQASHCCTAEVCLRQSVNQLYNKKNGQTCSFFHCLSMMQKMDQTITTGVHETTKGSGLSSARCPHPTSSPDRPTTRQKKTMTTRRTTTMMPNPRPMTVSRRRLRRCLWGTFAGKGQTQTGFFSTGRGICSDSWVRLTLIYNVQAWDL